MGRIHDDVRATHFRVAPQEEAFIAPFLSSFDVNAAKRVSFYGAQLSAYILGSTPDVKDMFGFENEVLLLASNMDRMQPRIMQAAARVFQERPYNGRVDPAVFFLLGRDRNLERWVADYVSEHPQSRIPIALDSVEVAELGKRDPWFIRNKIARQLYTRDLFDYQLPLDDDLYFFGREKLVSEITDSIRKSQNRGLFGLRKMGKTSLLYKIRRDCETNDIAEVFYYDCKRPDIRGLSWHLFLEAICNDVCARFKRNVHAFSKHHPTERIIRIFQAVSQQKRLAIIFDEIEYISPIAPLDIHWKKEFVPFWQTLWAAQSEVRKVSYVISGVNPYVCEVDLIDKVQNPMFGIVRPTFLSGLSFEEIKRMLRVLGKKMGIGFDDDAISYLQRRYGGHPLLTRMACSFIHHRLAEQSRERPFHLRADALQQLTLPRPFNPG